MKNILNILLVDDAPTFCKIIEKLIKEALGYNFERLIFTHVYDGLDALYLLKINKYDLVIIDIDLPGMNGVSVCSEIRAGATEIDSKSTDRNVSIILCTFDMQNYGQMALESGSDEILKKPFTLETLKSLPVIRQLFCD